MAKFYSSTFGAISGKHGSAVAVTRKDGVCYIRMHVIPHNPRTDKQQAHRSKIGLVSKSLAPFNPIFKHTMGVTNGISIARSHAFKHAIVDEYPNFSIDYKEIMFSFGAIEKLHNASVARNQSVMSVKWSFSEMYNCHGDDSVSFVIFNKDTKQVVHLDGVASRSDMEAQIEVYDSWAGADLYLWAYVRSGDGVSDSCFVGEMECDEDLNVCGDMVGAHSVDIEGVHAGDVGLNNDSNAFLKNIAYSKANYDKPKGIENNSVSDVEYVDDYERKRTITSEHEKVLLYLLDNRTINRSAAEELLKVKQTKAYEVLKELVFMELIVPKGVGVCRNECLKL